MSKKLITLLIPAYNEEENIDNLYSRLLSALKPNFDKYDFEFLFVNDGSKDDTVKKIKALREKDDRVSYVSFSRNFGKEVAMAAGFDYAKGDALVIIDADLQHPPELITDMIREWENGYDDVYALRRSRKGESGLRKLLSKIYYGSMERASRYPVYPDVGDFRLLDRRCVEAIKKIRETSRSTKNIYAYIGYKKKAISYEVQERTAGESKWSVKNLLTLALDGITSFTTSPLKISGIAGILTLVLGFIYFVVRLVLSFVGVSDLPLYFVPSILIIFFAGLQFIFLWIIGEYLGRNFVESKARPIYLVDEYNGEKEQNR